MATITHDHQVLIVGPGSIGVATACSLQANGISVKVLGKEHHKPYFEKNPAKYRTKSKEYSEKLSLITLEDMTSNTKISPDAIIITLKANQTMEMMKSLVPIISPNTPIISLQNGLVSFDMVATGKLKTVIGCVVGFNLKSESMGQVEQASEGKIVIGCVSNPAYKIPQWIPDMLSFIAPTELSSNIQGDIWMKLMINSTINPLCAIGDFTLGELAKYLTSQSLAIWIWVELFNAVNALQIKLVPFDGKLFPELLYGYDLISFTIGRNVIGRMVQSHKNAFPSMAQDIRAGKPTEIDFLNGKIVELAKAHNVSMPLNQKIIETIHKIESKELTPGKGLITKLYRSFILAPHVNITLTENIK